LNSIFADILKSDMDRNKPKPDQQLLPSVLDRLFEKDTASNRSGRTLEQMKRAIRQDLEDLLNTRQRPVSIPVISSEFEESLAKYGIPDPIGYDLSSDERIERFREQVENAIQRFEKRLFKVVVTVIRDAKIHDRILRFRIEASMRLLLVPEKVVFSMNIEPTTRKIKVKPGS
jgi:type VI secretion system protein ImpF